MDLVAGIPLISLLFYRVKLLNLLALILKGSTRPLWQKTKKMSSIYQVQKTTTYPRHFFYGWASVCCIVIAMTSIYLGQGGTYYNRWCLASPSSISILNPPKMSSIYLGQFSAVLFLDVSPYPSSILNLWMTPLIYLFYDLILKMLNYIYGIYDEENEVFYSSWTTQIYLTTND